MMGTAGKREPFSWALKGRCWLVARGGHVSQEHFTTVTHLSGAMKSGLLTRALLVYPRNKI